MITTKRFHYKLQLMVLQVKSFQLQWIKGMWIRFTGKPSKAYIFPLTVRAQLIFTIATVSAGNRVWVKEAFRSINRNGNVRNSKSLRATDFIHWMCWMLTIFHTISFESSRLVTRLIVAVVFSARPASVTKIEIVAWWKWFYNYTVQTAWEEKKTKE